VDTQFSGNLVYWRVRFGGSVRVSFASSPPTNSLFRVPSYSENGMWRHWFSLRRLILLGVLLGSAYLRLGSGGGTSRRSGSLRKIPCRQSTSSRPAFANRTFDPAAPPADMPPLASGENAECESNFLSNASVGGESRQLDATHATVTITPDQADSALNITIWGANWGNPTCDRT